MSLKRLSDFSGSDIKDGDDTINCAIGNIFTIRTLNVAKGLRGVLCLGKSVHRLTYAMLNVYLPFWASSTCSGLPVSTLYIEILPSFSPEITYLLHGEKPTVHKSTGPRVSICFFSPVLAFQRHMLESSELLAMAVEKCIFSVFPALSAHFTSLTLTIGTHGHRDNSKGMAFQLVS